MRDILLRPFNFWHSGEWTHLYSTLNSRDRAYLYQTWLNQTFSNNHLEQYFWKTLNLSFKERNFKWNWLLKKKNLKLFFWKMSLLEFSERQFLNFVSHECFSAFHHVLVSLKMEWVSNFSAFRFNIVTVLGCDLWIFIQISQIFYLKVKKDYLTNN